MGYVLFNYFLLMYLQIEFQFQQTQRNIIFTSAKFLSMLKWDIKNIAYIKK